MDRYTARELTIVETLYQAALDRWQSEKPSALIACWELTDLAYDFSNLSFADFEDLARDLIGAELGVRFEAFAAGPDGGMDGRHALAGEATILQAKQYVGSTFSKLTSVMRKERASINRLAPDRYLLATARPLTPPNKDTLATIIGPSLREKSDIVGREDLNGLLRKHTDVHKAHIKLWLSSTEVLERVLRASQATFTGLVLEDIQRKVSLYATNKSFDDARKTLEAGHILIVSGPPGVGKTTLAEMLAYAYTSEDWQLVPIRSLEDGFAEIQDSKKQVFFFDDFLGRVALDRHALATKDGDLARFVRRVRGSKNARFILTTRAYIYEEARRVSEHLADSRLDISKYVLDVGTYTRAVKARILYNHLLVAGTPDALVHALIRSGKLAKIIDHRNYSPRVIEWMTDGARLQGIAPEEYADRFLAALENPSGLWDHAFRTHIGDHCRHLLLAIFFCSQYRLDLDEARAAFNALHRILVEKYNQPHDPKDFEDSLHILEGGFLHIADNFVSFVNPSLRDYLTSYLSDPILLANLVPAARTGIWAKNLWDFWQGLKRSPEETASFAALFADFAPHLVSLPLHKRDANMRNHYVLADTTPASRLDLLMTWHAHSGLQVFADCALELAKAPSGGFTVWHDGPELVDLSAKLRDGGYYGDFPFKDELLELVDAAIIKLLGWGIASDDLDKMANAIDEYGASLEVHLELRAAIIREHDTIVDDLGQIDSEAALEEEITMLRRFGPEAGIPELSLARTVSRIEERIAELGAENASSTLDWSTMAPPSEKFDDVALQNLFMSLQAHG